MVYKKTQNGSIEVVDGELVVKYKGYETRSQIIELPHEAVNLLDAYVDSHHKLVMGDHPVSIYDDLRFIFTPMYMNDPDGKREYLPVTCDRVIAYRDWVYPDERERALFTELQALQSEDEFEHDYGTLISFQNDEGRFVKITVEGADSESGLDIDVLRTVLLYNIFADAPMNPLNVGWACDGSPTLSDVFWDEDDAERWVKDGLAVNDDE